MSNLSYKSVFSVCFFAGQFAVFTPVQAEQSQASKQPTNYLELIKILHSNKVLSDQQLQALQQSLAEPKHATDTDLDAEHELFIKTEGGLEAATYDGQYSFELSGRLMFDASVFNEDKNTLGNGTSLRRAYLGVEGNIGYDWGYEFTVDFADGDADIKNAYISYLGHKGWLWRIGNAKEPFSLAELTSSKYSTFMERPMLTEFAPGRKLGIHASTYAKHWTFAASITADGWDDSPEDEGDEGWGITARSTYAPWHQETQALHFGLALSHRSTDDNNNIKFNSRPEANNTDIKFVNTGKIKNVKDITRWGVEAAIVEGPFSLQAEYIATTLQRSQSLEDLSFDGWYTTASWMLTGESRDYKFKKGAFGRIQPYASSGAWEIAIRHSTLDLNDADITGGDSSVSTLGVNWYINDRTRAMLNYAWVDNDKFADDNEEVEAQDNPNYIQLRLQLDF